MSRGHGRIEREILALLAVNRTMTAPILAAFVYQDEPGSQPITRAQLSAVRRALSKLQKSDEVVKLGNMFQNERCSYASRAKAVEIVEQGYRMMGRSFFEGHPELVRLLPGPREG